MPPTAGPDLCERSARAIAMGALGGALVGALLLGSTCAGLVGPEGEWRGGTYLDRLTFTTVGTICGAAIGAVAGPVFALATMLVGLVLRWLTTSEEPPKQ